MNNLLRALTLCMIVLSSVAGTWAGNLTDAEKDRLHPKFQMILEDGLLRAGAPILKGSQPTHDAIIYTRDAAALRAAGIQVNSVLETFVTAQISTADLRTLATLPAVQYVDPGRVNELCNDVSIAETGASLLHAGFVNNSPYKGQGTIVVIYDTGIDWKHLDFRNPTDTTKSRILFIWDQTLTATGSEAIPAGFSYGVEYTKAQIENEIDGTPAGFVREKDTDGHGSHVAGTAAGNGRALNGKYTGMAPQADIIVIRGGETSFTDAKMIDGLTYVANKASALGKPVSVNWSIGSQEGPHDGTSAYEMALNSFVSSPGRVVVVSAGNDGDKNIHTGGTIAAGATATFTFTVPVYTPTSGTENDKFFFDLWFNGDPDVSATVTSPTAITYTRNRNEFGEAPSTVDGTIAIWNYLSSVNTNRNVQLFVHDKGAQVPKTGTWTFAVKNNSASLIQYDGWLSSRTVGTATVTLTGGNNDKSVAMPATASGAITVAAYVTKWSWPMFNGTSRTYSGTDRTANISAFSSIGPTRDGRQKPDIAAPGQGIASALSSSYDTTRGATSILPGFLHRINQGTSMAAPHVTGAAALLLGAHPNLTASQIKALLTSTANTDAFIGAVPNYTWGSGKMDILEALAKDRIPSATITRTTYAYDLPGSSVYTPVSGPVKVAVRFTPGVSGRLTGVQFNVTLNANGITGTGNLLCEVYSNTGGFPDTKIGNTVTVPLPLVSRATNNYIQMLDASMNVTSGTDYHIVLSAPGAGDTLNVLLDGGTGSANRSAWLYGSAWSSITPNNLRIRAIVASGTGFTSVEQIPGTPAVYRLMQNYPNPFNPATTVEFSLPAQAKVTLAVFNLLGQEVATLATGDYNAGTFKVTWTPENVASGMYIYRLKAEGNGQSGTFIESKRLVYLK